MKDLIVVVRNRNMAMAATRLGAQVELIDENAARDLSAAEETFSRAGILLLQLDLPAEVVEAALDLAGYHAVRVILRPAAGMPLADALLRRIDTLIANEVELAFLSETKDVEEGAFRLLHRGVRCLVVTLGENGIFVANGAGRLRLAPQRVGMEYSAAGEDVFAGAFAAALSEGRSPEQACRWGNAAMALAAPHQFDPLAFPTRRELEALIGRD